MSDSVRPHRRQPTRLPPPWDSPSKNTGVGFHFLLQYVESESEVAQSCRTLSDPMDCSLPGSSVHGILQARVLEWGASAFSFIQATQVQSLSPALAVGSLATEPQGKSLIFLSSKNIPEQPLQKTYTDCVCNLS